MSKAIVLLSGGMDSAVVLSEVVEQYSPDDIVTVFFKYSQVAYLKEKEAAFKIAEFYHLAEPIEIDLQEVFCRSLSSLNSSNQVRIKEGTYKEQGDRIPTSVVENRNMVFLSIGISLAMQCGCEKVFTGIRFPASEYGYADCSAFFLDKVNLLAQTVSDGFVSVEAPLGNMTRVEVIKEAVIKDAPIGLAYSCYSNEGPCGKCAPCLDRAKAFEIAGYRDPYFRGRLMIE